MAGRRRAAAARKPQMNGPRCVGSRSNRERAQDAANPLRAVISAVESTRQLAAFTPLMRVANGHTSKRGQTVKMVQGRFFCELRASSSRPRIVRPAHETLISVTSHAQTMFDTCPQKSADPRRASNARLSSPLPLDDGVVSSKNPHPANCLGGRHRPSNFVHRLRRMSRPYILQHGNNSPRL